MGSIRLTRGEARLRLKTDSPFDLVDQLLRLAQHRFTLLLGRGNNDHAVRPWAVNKGALADDAAELDSLPSLRRYVAGEGLSR